MQGVGDRAKCPFKKDIVEKYLVLGWLAGTRFGGQYTNGQLEFSDPSTGEKVPHSFS